MPDLLNALRRLYGEPGPEGIPAAGDEAEPRALAGVKAGLDALPKRRPAATTLEAVLATAAEPVALPDDDPSEAAALAEVEAGLAALPRRRPDAATLEAVFAAAAPAVPNAAPAADRPAQRPSSRRRVAGLGTAFALLLAVAGMLWLVPDDAAAPPIAANAPQQEAAPAEADAALAAEAPVEEPAAGPLADASPRSGTSPAQAPNAPGRSVARAVPEPSAPSPSAPLPPPAAAGVEPSALAAAQAEGAAEAADLQLVLVAEPMPLADGDEELRLLYLRTLEMRAAQAGLGWDEPPTALGATPDPTPAASGWMQVRVER
jgi:hypothetical protein